MRPSRTTRFHQAPVSCTNCNYSPHPRNRQIRFFIERKYVEDPKYAKLKVIFSGSDVPGEGEHKLLSFIRNLKLSPDFDPEWTHMIYGADADLIMLGLLTRLTNICILRENLKFK